MEATLLAKRNIGYAQFSTDENKRKTELLGEVGAQKIVQLVTDSTHNCTAARKNSSVAYYTIGFSVRTTHSLDLLLEDIGSHLYR